MPVTPVSSLATAPAPAPRRRRRPAQAVALALAAALAGLTLLAAGPVQAGPAGLRAESTIAGRTVTLGDLFLGLDAAKAERAIATAPEPGRRLVYDSRHLALIARRHGVNWQPVSSYDRAVIHRASTEIGPERLEAALRAALAEAGVAGPVAIELAQREARLHLPVTAPASLAVERLDLARDHGSFSARLRAPAEGPAKARTTLSGRIFPVIEIPVLTQRMRRGDIIRARHIDHVQRREDGLGGAAVLDAERLIGKTPRRLIREGRAVRLSDIQEPLVVRRGDLVTLKLHSARMRLTARGKALDHGARGETIRVSNVSSQRTVEARVTGPGTVAVPLPASLRPVR